MKHLTLCRIRASHSSGTRLRSSAVITIQPSRPACSNQSTSFLPSETGARQNPILVSAFLVSWWVHSSKYSGVVWRVIGLPSASSKRSHP